MDLAEEELEVVDVNATAASKKSMGIHWRFFETVPETFGSRTRRWDAKCTIKGCNVVIRSAR